MFGSVCKNLDMVGRLCENYAATPVWLVTTKWDKAKDIKIAENRVLQLEGTFRKPLITADAHHKKLEYQRICVEHHL